tara:strand:- start:450 stop:830 length:381 start_codon:yes stop_codon:yes gene_type:complete
MAISRANIGKEIKMAGSKKVKKYKKGKQVDKHGVEKSLPVKVFTKGKFNPDKTGSIKSENYFIELNKSVYGDKKIPKESIPDNPRGLDERIHNKLIELKKKKKKKVQKKKEGGMILDAKFVASFYD